MKWQDVWINKGNTDLGEELENLLFISGFTSDDKTLPSKNWYFYIEKIIKKVKARKEDRIFEAGCGAGAFLYPLYTNGYRNISGIDYAETMVQIAQRIMPTCLFHTGTITDMKQVSSETQDIVLCNSVYLYLSSMEEALAASKELVRVLKKGGRAAILDIPDMAKKQDSIDAKKKAIGEEAYSRLYNDSRLNHMYYNKDWFAEISNELKVQIEIEDQNIPGYTNSNFRFNAFLTKISS